MAGGMAATAQSLADLPTGRPNTGSMALRMLDLPTPELPVRAFSFPFMARRSSGRPSPVAALTRSTGMAEAA